MRQHPGEWSEETRYVLLYPSRNVSFLDAAQRYLNLLDDDTTFRALTIDDVVAAAFSHPSPTKDAFVRRYVGGSQ